MDTTLLRDAEPRDAEALARIYNQAVTGSTATFDTEPVTAEERVRWLAGHDEAHPVVVAVRAGEVIGWGSLSPISDRPAYDLTAEVSVYLDESHVGRGLGTELAREMIERAGEAGIHMVISRICTENGASITMCERLGFSDVGTMHEVGRKFDRWLDVVIMEKRLGD